MLQVPDINPYLKGGVIGVLIFVIIGLVIVIGWLLKNNLTSTPKPHGSPRELSAGEKSTEYWERVFEEIETEGNQALLKVLTEHHKSVMEMLGKLRARLRDSNQVVALTAIKDFRAKYDQDMIAIAKMLRIIEEKLDS
jgi:hypothetical protein